MEYKLIVTKEFEDDLDSVLSYISYKLLNPIASSRLLDKIQNLIDDIHKNPFLFPLYHNETFAEKGYRYAVVSNYIQSSAFNKQMAYDSKPDSVGDCISD